MTDVYLEPSGRVINTDAIWIGNARQVCDFLLRRAHPYARLIEVRASGVDENLIETIVLDVDVELSQLTKVDIHSVERLSICFAAKDHTWPEVFALRNDFPLVAHLNLTSTEFPRSLCLYARPYNEDRSRWAPISIVERARTWLAETATGSLHKSDQQLEQLFLGTRDVIILPEDFRVLRPAPPQRLHIRRGNLQPWGDVFVATRADATAPAQDFLATTFFSPPVTHGVLRWVPQNLDELRLACDSAGGDLLTSLRDQMAQWERGADLLRCRLVLVVAFPVVRTEGKPAEHLETWVFVTHDTIGVLGEILGIWELKGGVPGQIIGGTIDHVALKFSRLDPLNPTYALGREGAAIMNGLEADVRRITAIGLGALGSQVVTLLVRSGYGLWSLIDSDVLLPHNIARHQLSSESIALPKVYAMRTYLNTLLASESVNRAIFADVIEPGSSQTAAQNALESAHVILDFSATIRVPRHLTNSQGAVARCISVFMNPSGTVLVMLVEDLDRKIRLTHLEMQYYRFILGVPALKGHLTAKGQALRYAQSCRDITSTLPAHLVALHAATAAGAIRAALQDDRAQIKLWITQQDGSLQAMDVFPASPIKHVLGEFKLVVDDGLLGKLRELRKQELPRETGGVLLGFWDLPNKTAYIVDTISAPSDSKRRETSFIRGSMGLREQLESSVASTAEMIQYIGEWHSHPDGFSTDPSDLDLRVLSWIAEKTELDGYQAVMGIIGERDERWFVGTKALSHPPPAHEAP